MRPVRPCSPRAVRRGLRGLPQTQEIEFLARFPVLDGETEEGLAGGGGRPRSQNLGGLRLLLSLF